jgi:replication-associated recombination protein RarA
MQLHEQARPSTWGAVVGQRTTVTKLQTLAKRGLSGRAYWLSGLSGTGKTTIGKLIAAEVADEWSTEEIDAATLTVGELVKLEREMNCRSIGEKGGRAYLVNEAHGLKKPVINLLLVILERLPPHVVIVFTTTIEGQTTFEDCIDGGPLLSRCVRLALECRPAVLAQEFGERLYAVGRAEGLIADGVDVERCVRMLAARKCNFRAAYQDLEAGNLA